MNKSELVVAIQTNLEKAGVEATKSLAEKSLQAVLEGITEGLSKKKGSDQTVQLIGFGTFSITERAAREGINPKTMEKIKIAKSKSVKFKAGAKLKEVI